MELSCFGWTDEGGGGVSPITGGGTLNYIAMFTPNGTSIGDSIMSQVNDPDDATINDIQIDGNFIPDSTLNARKLGASTRRWDTLYMASNIDYANDLLFNSGGNQYFRMSTTGDFFISDNKNIDVENTGSKTLNIGMQNAVVINIGTGLAQKTINVGSSTTLLDNINIYGNIFSQQVTNLLVKDKLFTVNDGGAIASGFNAGFTIQEGGVDTGWFMTNSTRDGWDFKSPSSSYYATITQNLLSANRIYEMPNLNGTFTVLGNTTTGSGSTLVLSTSPTFTTDITTPKINTVSNALTIGALSSDNVYIGQAQHGFTNVIIYAAANANGYSISRVTATATSPNFVINRADTTTGIGGALNTISLIAQGTEAIRLTASASTSYLPLVTIYSGANANIAPLQTRITHPTPGQWGNCAEFGESGNGNLRLYTNASGGKAFTLWANWSVANTRWEAQATTSVGTSRTEYGIDGSITFYNQPTTAVTAGDALTFNRTMQLLGSGQVNIGNYASPTNLRLVTIGQDTAFVSLGSYTSVTSYGAIYMGAASPGTLNYTLISNSATTFINGTSSVNTRVNNSTQLAIGANTFAITSDAATSGTVSPFTITIPTNTGQTASTEIPNFKITGASKTWLAGAITTQRWNHFTANTAAFASASTITNSYGLYVEAATAGTNATITNNYAAGFSGAIRVIGALGSNASIMVDNSTGGYGALWSDGTQGLILRISATDIIQLGDINAKNKGIGFVTNGTTRVSIGASGGMTFSDSNNITFNTGTGTKIGTATTEKFAFWNATPIVQPTTAVAAATFVANTSGIVNDTATFDGYTIGQVVKALRNMGALE